MLLVVLASCAAVASEDVPSLDLLEFLGEWQDADGASIEPDLLDEIFDADSGDVAESGDARD